MAICEIAFGLLWQLVNIENPAAEWFVSPRTPRWRASHWHILLDVVDIFSRSRDCLKDTRPAFWLPTHEHKHTHPVRPLLSEEPTFNYCRALPRLPFNLNGDPDPQPSIYPLCFTFSALLSIYHIWLVSMEELNQWKVEKEGSWGRVTSLVIPGEPPNGWQVEWQPAAELTGFRCWTRQHWIYLLRNKLHISGN